MSPRRPPDTVAAYCEAHALRPFLVSPRWNRARLDAAPLGLPVAPEHIYDPLHVGTAPLLRQLERLDALTFGPEGMPMPRWLFFDGAEMPAAIVGLGRPANALSDRARELLAVPSDATEALIPLSMYIAVPTLEPRAIMGHNLASVNRTLPEEELRGLATLTKALGIAAFRARVVYGATQWRSPALGVHVRFGALELVTAHTPAHSNPRTLTYRVRVSTSSLRLSATGSAPALEVRGTRLIDADDEAAQKRLHERLRAGESYAIVGPPRTEGDRVLIPIARLAS